MVFTKFIWFSSQQRYLAGGQRLHPYKSRLRCQRLAELKVLMICANVISVDTVFHFAGSAIWLLFKNWLKMPRFLSFWIMLDKVDQAPFEISIMIIASIMRHHWTRLINMFAKYYLLRFLWNRVRNVRYKFILTNTQMFCLILCHFY